MNVADAEQPYPRARLDIALSAVCVALAIAIWIPGLRLLSRIWQQSEFFGHGYLIPLVSLLLLYTNRAGIAQAFRVGSPPAWGFIGVFVAASLEVLAISSEVATIAGLGIPLVLMSAVYAVGGFPLLRATALPFGFLLFMVPPPAFFIDSSLVDMKLFVTEATVGLLRAYGATVAATGNEIHVPGHTLFVADACSGLISLITLIPLAIVVAHFLSHGIWRRIVIFLSIVPLAILANVIRMFATVLLVDSRGIEFAQGLLHEGFGLTTYVGGTLALLAVAKVLR